MHYEINVSKGGLHYFGTHKRSLYAVPEAVAIEAARDIKKRFPAADNFQVTMTRWDSRGTVIDINDPAKG